MAFYDYIHSHVTMLHDGESAHEVIMIGVAVIQ